MTRQEFINILSSIKNKTIALVYTFKSNKNMKNYYDPWDGDVLSDWVKAVYNLKCKPFVIDFETFAEKAFNNSLPEIDFVVNLNNGSKNLSALSLIPSICAFLNIPCFPNNSETILLGENKHLSNLLAQSCDIKIPKYLNDDEVGIIRPNSSGSSKGIKIGVSKSNNNDIKQEFMPGFDMTISFMFNPLKNRLSMISPLMYLPNKTDVNWFLGETEKEIRTEYIKQKCKIDNKCAISLENFISDTFRINTLCRIDTRVKCDTVDEIQYYSNHVIPEDKIYFLEINPLPTLKENVNFSNTLSFVDSQNDFLILYEELKKQSNSYSDISFILLCMISSLF